MTKYFTTKILVNFLPGNDEEGLELITCLYCPAVESKGLTSWLSFVVSTVSLSLSHWYPGSGVVLDCIDS